MTGLFQQLTGPLYPILDWPMNSGPNGGYNFFSGIGLGGTGLTLWWHRHNCHEPGCLRIVRHGKTRCPRHEREAQP